jgi:hypothetical protein
MIKFCDLCHLQLQEDEKNRCEKCKEDPFRSMKEYYGKKNKVEEKECERCGGMMYSKFVPNGPDDYDECWYCGDCKNIEM